MIPKLSPAALGELKKLQVAAVYLFGSRAQGLAHPNADYDIGVVFSAPAGTSGRRSEMLLKLYDILSADVPERINGPRLDLSLLQSASPALAMAAVRYGRVLADLDPRARADFEEATLRRYLDYLPLKREYEEATFRTFTKPA